MRKSILTILAILVALLAALPARGQATVAIRAGATASYTDSTGQVWAADPDTTASCTGYPTAGVDIGTFATTHAIAGALPAAADQALYQTERYGVCVWTLTAPNGSYNWTGKFSENYFNAAGQRIFSMSLNGATVLSNFDIWATAGAEFTAVDKTFPVTVTNGTVVVQMIVGSANVPKIDAMELVPVAAPPPVNPTPPTAPATGAATIATLVAGTLTVAGTLNGAAVTQQFNTNSPIAFTFSGAQHSVTLNWTASSSAGVTGYNIFRTQTSGAPGGLLSASPVSGTSFTDTSIVPGQTYYYTVEAVAPACTSTSTGVCGSSAPSNQVTAAVPSP